MIKRSTVSYGDKDKLNNKVKNPFRHPEGSEKWCQLHQSTTHNFEENTCVLMLMGIKKNGILRWKKIIPSLSSQKNFIPCISH
jgi:hypothetical protein